jgi:hypothetical protein
VPEALTVAEAVEGFHVAAIVRGLDELGVLDAMAAPATPADLAAAAHVDAALLRLCLEYLAGRSTLVRRRGDRYVVTDEWDAHARACVRQYVGAYGLSSIRLPTVLRDPGAGAALVDRTEHARSYAAAPTASVLVADVVHQLGLTPTLDLGCGRAAMLVELGRRDPRFVGWGVDASPEMCGAARAEVAAAGLDDRVTIIEADAFDAGVLAGLPVDGVRALTATSLLDGLWSGRGGPTVASWLRSAAAAFPGCALVVADSFGRLGHGPPPWPWPTAVHDLVQALSGQGVPPPDHDGWCTAYEEAGALLAYRTEDERRSWFLHVVRLPDAP